MSLSVPKLSNIEELREENYENCFRRGSSTMKCIPRDSVKLSLIQHMMLDDSMSRFVARKLE